MGKITVGVSFWGFLARPDDHSEVETPDGLRGERAFFVEELLRSGHDVIQLQRRRERKEFKAYVPIANQHGLFDVRAVAADPTGFPDLDVLFVEWRWRIPHKSSEDWDRQCALLDHYTRVGTPIVVQDTDLKITAEDEARWPGMIIGDPCIEPCTLTRPRIKMPFCNVFGERMHAAEDSAAYVYVGNNYDRQAQFERYYVDAAAELRAIGIQTTVHGNWLTRSPERMHPRAIVQQYRHVAFAPRLAYRDVRTALNRSLAVCHISKPEYSARGNVTVRYFEAISAGVPALIPVESVHMHEVGDSAGLMVASYGDVVRKLRNLSEMSVADRDMLVLSQERALTTLADFSPANKVKIVDAVARREVT